MKSSGESLLSIVPLIRRARGYRLYTGDGRRYVDCWQDDGGTVLGHRAGAYRQAFLDKAARGLLLRIPGPEHRKLEKAVRALWQSWLSDGASAERGEGTGMDPERFHREATRRVYFFGNRERMYAALAGSVGALPRVDPLAAQNVPAKGAVGDVGEAGEAAAAGHAAAAADRAKTADAAGDAAAAADRAITADATGYAAAAADAAADAAAAGDAVAARDPAAAGRLVIARPFVPASVRERDWIEPVLPLPRALAPAVLLGPVTEAEEDFPNSGIRGDHIPAGMLAALTRAVYDLLRVQRSGVHPGRELAGELSQTGVWRSHGPWLTPLIGGAGPRYKRLFELHLAEGVLINPEFGGTSIVPAELSAGERAWLRRAALRAREEGLVE